MDDAIELSLDAFRELPKDSYLLIDIRNEVSYQLGHIDGAVPFHDAAAQADGRILVFYCQYGIESLKTAERSRSRGSQAYSLKGGYAAWLRAQLRAFDREEWERYDRQIILPQIGMRGQEKLKAAGVLLIGAGGLGCPCGMYLAAAGVGRIGIIDHDEVSLSNLNRQVAHRQCGVNKAISLKNTLVGINDRIEVTAYPYRFGEEEAAALLDSYDLVIDCTDTADTKFMVNDLCVRYDKPYCYGGVIGFEGQVMTVIPHKTACLRCIFEAPPTGCETCESHGIIGAAAGIIGCVQALEAIKYLTSRDELLTDRMFIFDMLTMTTRTVKFGGIRPGCPVCHAAQI